MTTTYPKPKGWPNPRLEQVTALKAEIETLEAEVEQLQEQARQAEAAMQEAVAREAIVLTVLRNLHNALMPYTESSIHGSTHCKFCGKDQGEWVQGDARWKPVHHEECPIGQTIAVLRNPPEATAALLKQLAELETQVADLRGALQAALLPLERAADALVPPGARGAAAALVEDALTAMREELE